jgi:hypothetical protein
VAIQFGFVCFVVVGLSNQAIKKQIKISRYRMRSLNTKFYIFSHYMIYCKIHVTVVCSIQMKNRKIVELSDIYLYICYFFLIAQSYNFYYLFTTGNNTVFLTINHNINCCKTIQALVIFVYTQI